MFPSPRDEGRHAPGPEPGWEESWQFDAATADGALGISVRLALRAGRAWYWAHVAGSRRDLVAVRDHDVDLPRGAALELRGSGLWAELTCETPLDHWSGGLEAFGVALDDPMEAYGAERGQPMAVGFDLEWEAAGPACPRPGSSGYLQPCTVHGDVLLGADRVELAGGGGWRHEWGVRNWWNGGQWFVHGQLDDGTSLWAAGSDPTADGIGGLFLAGAAEALVQPARFETDDGGGHLPRGVALTIGHTAVTAAVMAHAPVLVPGPDGRAGRLWRAVVRLSTDDGRQGAGWCERLTGAD